MAVVSWKSVEFSSRPWGFVLGYKEDGTDRGNDVEDGEVSAVTGCVCYMS
jgi:hypothetical protein